MEKWKLVEYAGRTWWYATRTKMKPRNHEKDLTTPCVVIKYVGRTCNIPEIIG